MTLQAKPAENARRVISASTRSSRSLASAFGSGLGGSSALSAFAPPLRFSARARIILNGVVMREPFGLLLNVQKRLEPAQIIGSNGSFPELMDIGKRYQQHGRWRLVLTPPAIGGVLASNGLKPAHLIQTRRIMRLRIRRR